MICVVQHKMKTIICTGVVWQGLPAAIAYNLHLALIAIWLLHAEWRLSTWSICDICTKHVKLPKLVKTFF